MLLTLLVLAPLFSELPKPVLAAVIIDAVVFGMIDVRELRRLRRVARFDFWIAVAAIVGVLSVGVLAGVVVGIVLSLGWLVYVATVPPMPLLGREPGTQVFRDLDENPADETFPGIPVLRLDSGLFFATSQALEDRVRELAQDGSQPLRALGFARLVRPGLGITAFGAQIMELPPDYTTESHDEADTGQQELYVALRGAGAVVIGDERLALDAEHLVRVDAGVGRVLASGPEGLRVLCIGAVPGAGYEPPAWTAGTEG